MQQTFLDIVYKIFYDTSQRDFKDVRLVLSENFSFPSIVYEPKIEVKIPIPKQKDGGISYTGYFFNIDDHQGRRIKPGIRHSAGRKTTSIYCQAV